MITPDSADWRRLAGASAAPLRWAYHRARGGPVLMLGERVLFAGRDGGFALVDARTGELRWRGAPAEGIDWDALAATPDLAGALGRGADATWLRTIDLASGASVDRRTSPKNDRVLARGSVLAVSDGCHLELLGPEGATVFAAGGRAQAVIGGAPICSNPSLLVAADDASVTIAHWVDERPRIERIEPRTGAVLEAIPVEPGASVGLDPVTGLVLVTAATGSVRAVRLGAPGPVSRTWTTLSPRSLDLRGVILDDGSRLLLVRDGRRWTVVDPLTLADRWTRTSDATVVLFGEVTPSREAEYALARAGELHWLAPRDGATITRRHLPTAQATTLHGERVLVKGGQGTVALDVRGGAVRWATRARIDGPMPGGLLTVRDPGVPISIGIIDARAGARRLTVELSATLVGRVPRDDGDLSVVAVRAEPWLAAYADDPAGARPLATDPIAAFAQPCGAGLTDLAELDRHRTCHPDLSRVLPFPGRDRRLPAAILRLLDRLARDWRRSALESPNEPGAWPQILLAGERSASEPPSLADERAAATRDALIERGVPCSAIHAAGRLEAGRARVELTWIGPLGCLL